VRERDTCTRHIHTCVHTYTCGAQATQKHTCLAAHAKRTHGHTHIHLPGCTRHTQTSGEHTPNEDDLRTEKGAEASSLEACHTAAASGVMVFSRLRSCRSSLPHALSCECNCHTVCVRKESKREAPEADRDAPEAGGADALCSKTRFTTPARPRDCRQRPGTARGAGPTDPIQGCTEPQPGPRAATGGAKVPKHNKQPLLAIRANEAGRRWRR